MTPVTRPPALAPKETGGSPEFPDYPSVRMPRSQTPVVSRPLALPRTGLLPSVTRNNTLKSTSRADIVEGAPDGERCGSPAQRHRRPTWNGGTVAGFGASALLGVLVMLG